MAARGLRHGCGRQRRAPRAPPGPAGSRGPGRRRPEPRRGGTAGRAGRAPGGCRGRGARRVEGHRGQGAVHRDEGAGAEDGEDRRRDEVRVGHPEWIAEQELLEPRRGVGREREQPAEAEHPGHHDGGGRVRADALVARRDRHERRGHRHTGTRAEQQRGSGQRGQHEARAAGRGRATRPRRRAGSFAPRSRALRRRAEQDDLRSRAARCPERHGSARGRGPPSVLVVLHRDRPQRPRPRSRTTISLP